MASKRRKTMSLRNRRHFLKTTAAAALAAGCSVQPKPSTATGPKRSTSGGPNILVFLTDDHGQRLQQAYGNFEVRTANMPRIVTQRYLQQVKVKGGTFYEKGKTPTAALESIRSEANAGDGWDG